MAELVVCSKCFEEFDPIGERNCCPVCDEFLGGDNCFVCEFSVEEKISELISGKILNDYVCTFNGLCPFYDREDTK